LLEERDHLSSKYDELEETLRGVLETVFFQLGGASSLDARPILLTLEEQYPDISSILEELEEIDLESAKHNYEEELGSFSILAHRRGLLMSKKQFAKFRLHELASSFSGEMHLREAEALRGKNEQLQVELHSRNLTIRSLKEIVLNLKKKVIEHFSKHCKVHLFPKSMPS
jgi:hypothetical protein